MTTQVTSHTSHLVPSIPLEALGARQVTSRKTQDAFSKSASRYDEYAHLQKTIGLKLLDELKGLDYQSILDVGMGTGWLTQKLCEKFSRAYVAGIDFAQGMIECAKTKSGRSKIIHADACALPFQPRTFDLVFSNLAYQWVKDLPLAFGMVHGVLKGGGHFYFSSFGPRTLEELFVSLENAGNGRHLRMQRLAGEEEIKAALFESGFDDVQIRSEVIQVNFLNPPDLIRWLKIIGANNPRQDIFVGKDLLRRADAYYKANFRNNEKIFATFEVLWAKAKKPTEETG